MRGQQPDSGVFTEASGYEQFMGRWSRKLAPLFWRFAHVRDGARVLDIGSGTGVLAFAIAAATRRSEVVGIDPSRTYVDFAASRTGNARVQFQTGDAQKLTFANGAFDASVSLLVINFIPDARKALAEMRRVSKPGGVVAAAVWDYPEGMRMLRVFWNAAVALDPAAARWDEKNMPFCRRGELGHLWREAGLREVRETELRITLEFRSFDDYWAPFLQGQGPAGSYAAGLSEEKRSALRNRLRKELLGSRPDGAFRMKARAWAVRGVS